MTRTATHYTVKVDIGGLSGVLAPLLGKQPPDSHVWILGGDAPVFVRSEQPLFGRTVVAHRAGQPCLARERSTKP